MNFRWWSGWGVEVGRREGRVERGRGVDSVMTVTSQWHCTVTD